MEKTEHSPLPWVVSLPEESGQYSDTAIYAPGTYHPWLLAEVFGPDNKTERSNAELIVTAVNNHARLVKKLEELRDILNMKSKGNRVGDWSWSSIAADIDELLASVNEGSK